MKCYGSLALTVSSPPQTFAEPLTLNEVKKYLELPERSPVDDGEDATIEGFIIGAREQAELLQNRDLVEKQYDLRLDYFPCEIQLRTPLASVDLITYKNSDGDTITLVEGTDYIVDTARGLVMPVYNGYWPSATLWPSSAVLVRFTAGYSTTDMFWSDSGQRILVGMKELINHWYTERLPFEMGNIAAQEYPFTVTMLLSAGAVPRQF